MRRDYKVRGPQSMDDAAPSIDGPHVDSPALFSYERRVAPLGTIATTQVPVV
jgi:hypothetical protein